MTKRRLYLRYITKNHYIKIVKFSFFYQSCGLIPLGNTCHLIVFYKRKEWVLGQVLLNPKTTQNSSNHMDWAFARCFSWLTFLNFMEWAHSPHIFLLNGLSSWPSWNGLTTRVSLASRIKAHYFLIISRFMTYIISLILNETNLPSPIKAQNYTKWILEEKRPISRLMVYLGNKIMKP